MYPQVFFKCLVFVFGFGGCLSDEKKNVLFLMIDDLRPQLNAYDGGHFPSTVSPPMKTPNIDKIAGESILFKRAYVQQAVCCPSRSSLLTGRRPDTTHVYNLNSYFRDVGGNFTTIPQFFKGKNYTSIGMGKIFHPGNSTGSDDPISWSVPFFHGISRFEGNTRSWRAVSDSELGRRSLRDTQIADKAVETIRSLSSSGETFFLAVGFHKPHEPFVFPEKYLNDYPEESINLPNNNKAPVNMPDVAWNRYDTITKYDDIAATNVSGDIGTVLPDDVVKSLRRAYYATVTYIDSLVGQIYQELETQNLLHKTIISLISDHGYQLGEHGEWGKRTNFELSTHTPMMIRVPGKTDVNGVGTEQLVEFVDLFPTLVEAAGLGTIPQCPENSGNVMLCHEGESLMPLIDKPDIAIKNAAFSQVPRFLNNERVMGYTMRTDKYRYTEWVKFQYNDIYEPDWNDIVGKELYDHSADGDENFNIVDSQENSDLVINLSRELREGWRTSDPPAKRLLDAQENVEAVHADEETFTFLRKLLRSLLN